MKKTLLIIMTSIFLTVNCNQLNTYSKLAGNYKKVEDNSVLGMAPDEILIKSDGMLSWYGYWIKLNKVDSTNYYIEDKQGRQAAFLVKDGKLILKMAVGSAIYKKQTDNAQ